MLVGVSKLCGRQWIKQWLKTFGSNFECNTKMLDWRCIHTMHWKCRQWLKEWGPTISLNVQNVLVYPSIRRARIFCITIKYRRWHFANIYVYEKAFRTETNLQTEGKGIHKFMLYFATLEYFGKRYILDTFVHFTLYHLSVCSWYFHYYKANSFCVLIKYSSWYEITFSRY